MHNYCILISVINSALLLKPFPMAAYSGKMKLGQRWNAEKNESVAF